LYLTTCCLNILKDPNLGRRMQIKPETQLTQLFYLLPLDDFKLPNKFSRFCHC
jgi:hypothetical protein